jgi:hypothetical protein
MSCRLERGAGAPLVDRVISSWRDHFLYAGRI